MIPAFNKLSMIICNWIFAAGLNGLGQAGQRMGYPGLVWMTCGFTLSVSISGEPAGLCKAFAVLQNNLVSLFLLFCG